MIARIQLRRTESSLDGDSIIDMNLILAFNTCKQCLLASLVLRLVASRNSTLWLKNEVLAACRCRKVLLGSLLEQSLVIKSTHGIAVFADLM